MLSIHPAFCIHEAAPLRFPDTTHPLLPAFRLQPDPVLLWILLRAGGSFRAPALSAGVLPHCFQPFCWPKYPGDFCRSCSSTHTGQAAGCHRISLFGKPCENLHFFSKTLKTAFLFPVILLQKYLLLFGTDPMSAKSFQAWNLQKPERESFFTKKKTTWGCGLSSQFLSSFCPSSSNYFTATSSTHSFPKTMNFLALSFLWLICHLHSDSPPFWLSAYWTVCCICRISTDVAFLLYQNLFLCQELSFSPLFFLKAVKSPKFTFFLLYYLSHIKQSSDWYSANYRVK